MFLDITHVIDKYNPDVLGVEACQGQTSPKAMLMLSQLQGMCIGKAYLSDIPVVSPMPTEWRKILGFKQGPGVKRAELKKQAVDFVRQKFGLTLSEDEAEATCLSYAIHLLKTR